MGSFDELSTEKFRKRMRPSAERIFQQIYPHSIVYDLREDGADVHVLDKSFGIDTLIKLPSGADITVQEKYRKHEYLRFGDFTQEYKNAAGTQYETDGEWFHLGAQIYFYGWANQDETGFAKWFTMDIAGYKTLVDSKGGLGAIGTLRKNKTHGSASFYSIPLYNLRGVILKDSDTLFDAPKPLVKPIRLPPLNPQPEFAFLGQPARSS